MATYHFLIDHQVKFRSLGGLPGEGLLFNMHEGALGRPKPASAQVVRVDPEGLYYGYLDATGEFHGEGPVPELVVSGTWNEVEVRVNNEAGRNLAKGIFAWRNFQVMGGHE